VIGIELVVQAIAAPAQPADLPDLPELGLSDATFRAVYDQAGIGICVAALDGRLLHVNPGFCALTGYSADEALQLGVSDLPHEDDRARADAEWQRARAGAPSAGHELCYQRRDGATVWVQASHSLLRAADASPRYVLSLIQDVNWTTRLRHLALAMAAALTPEQVAALILDHTLDALGARGGAVRQLQPDTQSLDTLHLVADDPAAMEGWRQVPLELALPVTEAVRSGEIVLLESRAAILARFPHLSQTVQALRHHAFAALPLQADGQLLGSFSLWFDAPHVFTDGERTWLAICAQQCGQALARAIQYRAEQATGDQRLRAEQESRLLADIAWMLSEPLDYRERLDALARRLVPALANWCVIDELLEDGSIARAALVADTPGRAALLAEIASEYPLDRGSVHPVADALRSQATVHIPLISDDWLATALADERLRALTRRLEMGSAVTVPLTARGQTLGALTLGACQPGRFGAAELPLIEEIGRRAALALDNARLYQAATRARERSDEMLALLDTIFTHAPTGLTFLDTEFRYVRINEALAAMNGLPVEAHIGRSVREVLPTLADPVEAIYRQILATGEAVADVEVIEERAAEVGGRRIWQASYYPVRLPGGELAGIGIVANDVTETRAASDALRESEARAQALLASEQMARLDAQEAVRVRDSVIAVASHDLRSPLTVLLGQAQILERRLLQEGGSERLLKSARTIAQQAERLNRMVGALLDLSRIQMGEITIDPEPLDLAALLRRTIDDIQPTLSVHRLLLRGAGQALMVSGDELRLEQVFHNLLNNAVKYSPQGGDVLMELERRGEHVAIEVVDSGIGIAPEALPRLFERFYRAPSQANRTITGLGVGLYVVREIVVLHGGTVTVSSTEGEGSRFTVLLPALD
jgi:PAS domain S-box-containing protein